VSDPPVEPWGRDVVVEESNGVPVLGSEKVDKRALAAEHSARG